MKKTIKAFALVEKGTIGLYYLGYQIYKNRMSAIYSQRYYNSKPLRHSFEIVPCTISYSLPSRKGKKK